MTTAELTTPLRVLHLEDSPRDAEVVRHKLLAEGVSCDIVLVADQKRFEAALEGQPFALILLDYNLPGYDGITALKHAQQTRPDVPVILISGTVGDEDAVKCLHFGATDYLLKDRLDRLGPAVERALAEAEARRTRKGAEAALVDLRDALNLHAIVAVTNPRGTITEVNDKFCEVSGYSREELVGQDHRLVNSGHHSREFIRDLWTTIKGGRAWHGEIKNKAKDGSFYWLDTTIVPLLNDDGTPRQFMRISGVVTARKDAEQALRNERDRAQRYLDTAQVILLKLDLDGRIAVVNRYACDLLGWTAEELIGRDWIDTCLPLRIRERLRNKLDDVVGGDLATNENPILTRSGQERLVEWRPGLLRDDDGNVVGTFSSGTDITERSRAVEALRTGDERTRFALESANVGIWDMDYTTGVLQWSKTLEGQYGLPPGTFVGTFDAFIGGVHPEDRKSVLDTVGRAARLGGDFSIQNRSLWPDGTVRWLSGAGRIQLGERQEPLRGVGISLDVTEARSLEAQYQQAQKMEAIGQLAAGVAHDFNNLLTVILGFCELLLEELDSAGPHHADVTEIQKAGQRGAGLTRQLLTFSRKEIIEPTLLDVNKVVSNMRVLLGRLIGEDVAIVLALGSGVAPVKADRGQLEQIVMNLAVNARDAMPTGGQLTIETANVDIADGPPMAALPHGTNCCVTLKVTDTGTGMTPDVQSHLFEPFFTTKAVGKGTGLGLATVHGIATRSGGTVTVASEIGKGTSFTVYLPRADGEEAVVDTPPAVRTTARRRSVLLIEDEDALRELTKRLLQRLGYTVLVAANADQARQLVDKNESIELILTDVVMPELSGPELVKLLLQRRPTLKVIYMSGYTDDAIVRHGVLEPGIDFMAKPFTSARLGQKILEVLNR